MGILFLSLHVLSEATTRLKDNERYDILELRFDYHHRLFFKICEWPNNDPMFGRKINLFKTKLSLGEEKNR